MTVEQKFSSHLVPAQHRVRQATSEFKDFAIIWWNELVNARAAPQTWPRLKEEMRVRFVPPSYRHDLLKKLQSFDQGDMSVQEYYQELQKGMLRCEVVEDQEDQIVWFYGGLRRDIQDIVDYKEYHSIQRLFHLSMLAEKNCRVASSSGGATPSRHDNLWRQPNQRPLRAFVRQRLHPPLDAFGARSTAPPPSRGHDHSGSTAPQGVAAKNSSSNPSPGRTSDIKCHRCKGLGHMQRDCPSKRAYIATGDGGYVSASDVEDEDIIAD